MKQSNALYNKYLTLNTVYEAGIKTNMSDYWKRYQIASSETSLKQRSRNDLRDVRRLNNWKAISFQSTFETCQKKKNG